MRKNKEWFKSWFDSPYYPILYRNRDDKEARQFIDALLSFIVPEQSAEVLDLACGRGRHSIYLHSLGYRVTGIDISQNSIDEAGKHASQGLSFHVQDMREPFNLAPFDLILNMFTSFGYFDTDEEHQKVIQNAFDALKRNGIFVLDYLNTDYVKAHLVEHEYDSINGIDFDVYRTLDESHIIKHINVKDGDNNHHFEERVKAYAPDQLTQLMKLGDFKIEHCFGDYELNPLTKASPRCIIVARKEL